MVVFVGTCPVATQFVLQASAELIDLQTIRTNRAATYKSLLNHIMPHPLKFKRVWHMSRGDKSLYAWKAIAPENFIALGGMVTSSDADPDVTLMRCVPKGWVTKSSFVPQQVWDDTGAGGGKPGSMWAINKQGLIVFVPGHEPPKEDFYDFSATQPMMKGIKLETFVMP